LEASAGCRGGGGAAGGGFQPGEFARRLENDLGLFAVHRRNLDGGKKIIGGCGAAAESGHGMHGASVGGPPQKESSGV